MDFKVWCAGILLVLGAAVQEHTEARSYTEATETMPTKLGATGDGNGRKMQRGACGALDKTMTWRATICS